MEVFYTDTDPCPGKLRVWAEDFHVAEIGGAPKRSDDGKHVALQVRLTNWEQNHFIRDAARKLGVSRKGVGFCGTKDKRAVTTQWFTFQTKRPVEDARTELGYLNRVEVLDAYRTERGLRLGGHDGNRFQIRLRGVPGSHDDVATRVDATLAQLRELGGVPNFFGIQRFGAIRPITQDVGRHIVRNDIQGAVLCYLTDTAPNEAGDEAEARQRLREDQDLRAAVSYFPTNLRFERSMIQHLAGAPGDWVGALRQLPRNLVLLFVHAYQSYLFNRMLSERIRRGLPLATPLVGDHVLPLDQGDLAKGARPMLVTEVNLAKIQRQVTKGRALPAGVLVGLETPLAHGEPGEIERAVLDAEGVSPEDLRSLELPEASSTGTWRTYLNPVWGLEWAVNADEGRPVAESEAQRQLMTDRETPEGLVVTLSFGLPRGAYATGVLREVMKSDATTDY